MLLVFLAMMAVVTSGSPLPTRQICDRLRGEWGPILATQAHTLDFHVGTLQSAYTRLERDTSLYGPMDCTSANRMLSLSYATDTLTSLRALSEGQGDLIIRDMVAQLSAAGITAADNSELDLVAADIEAVRQRLPALMADHAKVISSSSDCSAALDRFLKGMLEVTDGGRPHTDAAMVGVERLMEVCRDVITNNREL